MLSRCRRPRILSNGSLFASSTFGNFTFNWNTSKLARGTYRLQSRAFDAAGNSTLSAIVSVVR